MLFRSSLFYYILIIIALTSIFIVIYIILPPLKFIENSTFSEEPLVVSLYGDSLMSGYKVDTSDSLAYIFAEKLTEKGIQNIVHNNSISGDTSSQALARIGSVTKEEPDIVILCFGANDMLQNIDPVSIYKNMELIISKLQEEDIVIILVGMYASRILNKNYINQFDKIFPDLAKKYNLIFMPFLLKDVAFKTNYLLADMAHPNPKGIKKMADNLWEFLNKAIKEL